VNVYRTPDERFRDLPGFPFEPRYFEHDGLRMHYLDEGHGDPILLLHGEPDWSYLYRKMVPALAGAFRVVVPDYFGFGRSDKPAEIGWYSYDRHVESIQALIAHLGLDGISVAVHDWGGPIGLRVAAEDPERFARLIVFNTGLFVPSRSWPTEGFLRWRAFAERHGLEIDAGRVMEMSVARGLTPEVVAAYNAPFPTPESKAGVAAFPLLVPLKEGDPGAAEMARTREVIESWDVRELVVWSDSDPVFPLDMGRAFAKLFRNAREPVVIKNAGHMLQEDAGEEVADIILEWCGAT
jgi:haloalkane dehalogenase